MNEPKLKAGQVWVYFGPGIGRGVRHKITSADGGEVTTWSEPSRDPNEGGQTWLGTESEFRRLFRLVKPGA